MNHDYRDEAREIVEWWQGSSYETKKEYEILINQIAYELVKASKEGYEQAIAKAEGK